MDVIEFIENDVKRVGRRSAGLNIIFSIGIFLIPIGLGLFLRDDLNGAFEPRIFIPNLMAIGLLMTVSNSSYSKNYSAKRPYLWGITLLLVALLLATERVVFPPGPRTTYASSAQFWHESIRCFIKGGISTLVAGLWLCTFAYFLSSWPSRRWRCLLSFSAGAAGTAMLGFHCDSSSLMHVLVGHIGQGLALGALVFAMQEIIFHKKLVRSFPILASRLKRLYKLG